MGKILLLVSAHPQDQVFAAEAAAVSGLVLRAVRDARQAAAVLSGNEDVGAVFVDVSDKPQYDSLERALQDTVGLFSERVHANAFHFISSSDLSEATYLIESPVFGNFVTRKYGDPKMAGAHYGRVVRFTLQDRAFGLSRFFAEGVRVQTLKFQRAIQKQNGVEAIKNFLVQAKFSSRMSTLISNAVDEILMNSMYDAPVDEFGKHIYSSTSRSTDRVLSGKDEVEMHVAFDGNYVAISAVDQYGSLDKVKLMSHLLKIYTEEEYRVRTTTAGAGLGLATVFRSGGSFLFSSEAHVRTEVTVFFKKVDSFKAFKDQFQFIATQFYF